MRHREMGPAEACAAALAAAAEEATSPGEPACASAERHGGSNSRIPIPRASSRRKHNGHRVMELSEACAADVEEPASPGGSTCARAKDAFVSTGGDGGRSLSRIPILRASHCTKQGGHHVTEPVEARAAEEPASPIESPDADGVLTIEDDGGVADLIEQFDHATVEQPEARPRPTGHVDGGGPSEPSSQSARELIRKTPHGSSSEPGTSGVPRMGRAGSMRVPSLSRAMTQPVLELPYFNVRTAPRSDEDYDASVSAYRSRRQSQFGRLAEKCGYDKGAPVRAAAALPGPRPPMLHRRNSAPVLDGTASIRGQHAVSTHLARQQESPAGSSPKTQRERAKKELGKPSGDRRLVGSQSVYDRAKSRAAAIMSEAGIQRR